MGFFRDLKNIREAAAEHGGMPNLADASRDISRVFDDRGERAILESGTPAKAIVRGMLMPVEGDRFALQVPMEVHPPQGSPYEIQYVFPASRMLAPLSPGLEVPIKISKDDPKRIAVQWDAQQAAVAAAGGAIAAAQEGLARLSESGELAGMYEQAMKSVGAAPLPGFAGVPQQLDPATRLKQLEQLKDAGLIDDDEYRAKKQSIIDAL